MPTPSQDDLTRLLQAWTEGDADALPRLMEAVYPELHRIAARFISRERPGHTLQPTALVNEAYLRFAQQRAGKAWNDRTHFFAVSARVLRAVLVDHARARDAMKRGDGQRRTSLTAALAVAAEAPVDILDLDGALQELEALNPDHCRILELRYFAGLSLEEAATALGVSLSTVKRGWLAAKTFVRHRLEAAPPARHDP